MGIFHIPFSNCVFSLKKLEDTRAVLRLVRFEVFGVCEIEWLIHTTHGVISINMLKLKY